MKTSEPKMILNLSVESNELEEKVKLAMDKYVEGLVHEKLDAVIAKFVCKRVENLIACPRYSNEGKIQGKSFEDFVKEKTEKRIEEIIDKNIKTIFAKKVAEMI